MRYFFNKIHSRFLLFLGLLLCKTVAHAQKIYFVQDNPTQIEGKRGQHSGKGIYFKLPECDPGIPCGEGTLNVSFEHDGKTKSFAHRIHLKSTDYYQKIIGTQVYSWASQHLTDMAGNTVGFINESMSISDTNKENASQTKLDEASALCNTEHSYNNKYPRKVIDVNSDNRLDIVVFSEKGITVSMNNQEGYDPYKLVLKGFSPSEGGWSSQEKYPRDLADVNGDGYPDIIGFGHSAAYVHLGKGDGTFDGEGYIGTKDFSNYAGWDSNTKTPRMLQDINNDGRADIIGFTKNEVYVALATEEGFFNKKNEITKTIVLQEEDWSAQEKYEPHLADLNNDGFIDIVNHHQGNTYIYMNDGKGGFNKPSVLSDYGLVQKENTDEYNMPTDTISSGSDNFVGSTDIPLVVTTTDSINADDINSINTTKTQVNGVEKSANIDMALAESTSDTTEIAITSVTQDANLEPIVGKEINVNPIDTMAYNEAAKMDQKDTIMVTTDLQKGNRKQEKSKSDSIETDSADSLLIQSMPDTTDLLDTSFAYDTSLNTIITEEITANIIEKILHHEIIEADKSDTIWGYKELEEVLGTQEDDIIIGWEGSDLILADDGDDLINGGDGFDIIYGGRGDDIIVPGSGKNKMAGGPGNDVFVIDYNAISRNEIKDFTLGDLILLSGTTWVSELQMKRDNAFKGNVLNLKKGGITFKNFNTKNLTENNIILNNYHSIEQESELKPDEQTDYKYIRGYFFRKGISDHKDMTTQDWLLKNSTNVDDRTGTDKDDKLRGNFADNLLIGMAGDDRMYGGAGNDLMYAGKGSDYLEGGRGNDFISGGGGRDKLFGGLGNDKIYGNAGHDYLMGNDGDDLIDGGGENDIIYGGKGNDELFGGAGNDVIYDGLGDDVIHGGNGEDVFHISGGNNQIISGEGRDIISFDNLTSSTKRNGTVIFDFEMGKDVIDVSLVGIRSLDEIKISFTKGTSDDGIRILLSKKKSDFQFGIDGHVTLIPKDFIFYNQTEAEEGTEQKPKTNDSKKTKQKNKKKDSVAEEEN